MLFLILDWLRKKKDVDLSTAVRSHVTTVMTELKNIVEMKRLRHPIVDVVNEVGGPGDFLFERLGLDYVKIAYEAAKRAYPEALLLLNHFGNHTKDGPMYAITKEVTTLLNGLLYAVGAELLEDAASPSSEKETTEGLASYNLPVIVSENVVDLRNISGTKEVRFLRQKEVQRSSIRSALRSKAVIGFIPFQVGDKFSIWNDPSNPSSAANSDPTLYDNDLQPKPSYYGLMQGMFETWTG